MAYVKCVLRVSLKLWAMFTLSGVVAYGNHRKMTAKTSNIHKFKKDQSIKVTYMVPMLLMLTDQFNNMILKHLASNTDNNPNSDGSSSFCFLLLKRILIAYKRKFCSNFSDIVNISKLKSKCLKNF